MTEGGAAVATASTKPQSNAIGATDWVISSMNALPGTKKLTMSRTLLEKRRCC
jgi:hypothetical protein